MPSPSIQSANQYNGGGSPNGSCAYPSNNTAGNTSVVTLWYDVIGATASIPTDTQGNTYVLAATAFSALGGSGGYMWVATNIKPGPNTVSCVITSPGDMVVTVDEEPASGGIRVANSNYNPANANPSVSLVGTVTNDVVVGFCLGVGTGQAAGSIGGNSAFQVQNPFGDILTEDGFSSGGTITVSSTGSNSGTVAIAAALKPPGGPADAIFFGSD
jgi:hypothetical protein